ncbi:MAG: choice-of-anchor D domain-containing protein, partial [Rubricoccaceae bacterium]|nr:choice-of-anchor D domain-containing protein [Rubricoccaceae bacterium]
MKRLLHIFSVVLFLVASPVFAQTYVDVIDPAGNPSLWGLEWRDGFLYATNTADDNVIQIDPKTGAVSVATSLDFDPRGVAWDGTNWRVSTSFDSSAPEIHTIAPDGTNLGSIPAPGQLTHGLTLHDGLLFAAAAHPNETARIAGLDPTTGAENETIDFPETQPGGIAFIETNTFWATNVGDDGTNIEMLYRIDRLTGTVLQELELPEGAGRPRGLAYDGSQFLYLVVREGTPWVIYKIDLLDSGNPEITLSAESFDFGPRVFGSTYDLELTIGNEGDGDLEISNVQITGPDADRFTTSLTDTTIPASSSTPFDVSFSPTQFGPRSATLSFETNDVAHPLVEIPLAGIGIYAEQHILLEPASLDFGEVRVDPSGQRSAIRLDLNVINGGASALTVSDMTTNDDAFSVLNVTFPFDLNTLDTTTVEVEFRPTEIREYDATLTVSSNDPGNPNAEVPLSGEGIQPNLEGGDVVWMIETPDNPNTSFDDPKIFSIVVPGDLTGDGVADLVFASRNYLVWAVDGNGWGETSILWTFNSCPNNNNCGAVSGNSQLFEYGMATGEDFDDDGINDIVIGTEGGNDHVYVLSGVDGSVIWEVGSDTDPYLAGYYSVAIGPDINNDG